MIGLGIVALAAALAFAADRWARVLRERLAFDRARYEARKPVPPHEQLVEKVEALSDKVGAIEAWVKR